MPEGNSNMDAVRPPHTGQPFENEVFLYIYMIAMIKDIHEGSVAAIPIPQREAMSVDISVTATEAGVRVRFTSR